MKQLRTFLTVISIMLFFSTWVMFLFDAFIAVMLWFAFLCTLVLLIQLPDLVVNGVWIRRVR